jgi:hypothetical protein
MKTDLPLLRYMQATQRSALSKIVESVPDKNRVVLHDLASVWNTQNYQFTRVQWGLVNAATTFQAYIEDVLNGVSGVIVYIDDILVYADSETARLKLL